MEDTAELEIVRRPPSVTIAFRVLKDEHEQILAYAKAHNASPSDVIRSALIKVSIIDAAKC